MFILRIPGWGGSKTRYVTASNFIARRVEKTRVKAVRTIGGMTVNEVEGTGKYLPDFVSVRASEHVDPTFVVRDQNGSKGEYRHEVGRNAADVKKHIRRLRPEEQALLDEHDARIAALLEQLKQERAARRETIAAAWTKAHVVRLGEVDERVK